MPPPWESASDGPPSRATESMSVPEPRATFTTTSFRQIARPGGYWIGSKHPGWDYDTPCHAGSLDAPRFCVARDRRDELVELLRLREHVRRHAYTVHPRL